MGLSVTLGLLVAELVLFGFCYWQDRKPINPMKPRLLPYRLVMMTLIVLFLATLAHAVALITGTPVKPRGKMGMGM